MRDLVARTLHLVLRILLPARGRHRSTVRPACVPVSEPLPPPVPVRRFPAPDREELHRFVEQQIQRAIAHRRLQYERRFALSEAVAGRDHPYSYPGAPFPRSAFAPAGGGAAPRRR
jgi:hypothetical protein